jgi:hypothetical protein
VLALGLAAAEMGAGADAQAACTCEARSPEQALDDADAAIVGRIVREGETDVRGARQSLYTVVVTQQVKGGVADRIEVRSPPACDIMDAAAPPVGEDGTVGLLLTRSPDGAWLANACSVVAVPDLIEAGGGPRGGVIKVVLGVLILALVLSWALRRKARGTRPSLPGAPEP